MKPHSPTITSKDRYQRKEGVYSSELDSETVLLDQTQGLYFGLQGIGVRDKALAFLHRSALPYHLCSSVSKIFSINDNYTAIICGYKLR